MRYPLLLLTGLLVVACSDRERANPLDPDNPVTTGAPTGFQAVANRDTALLSWDPVKVNDLLGYNIYRSVGSDTKWQDTRFVSPGRNRFQDLNLFYDTTYTYAVQAITERGESRLSPLDTLIPGPYNFWVADFNSGVWRISYDGSHVLGREYEYSNSPEAVVYHPGEGRVWVANYYDQAVYYMDVHFTGIDRIVLPGRSIDIVTDTTAGCVFILQIAPDAIYQVTPAVTTLTTNEIPVRLDPDASFTLDLLSASLWLSTPTGSGDGIVYRLRPPAPGGRWELAASIPKPRKVAADPVAGGCWVATDSGVVRIDTDGRLTTYLTDHRVLDISLNPVNGDCYYVTNMDGGKQWEAGYLTGWPSPQPIPILNNDYPYLVSIQVLPDEGQAGFLVGQVSIGRLLRFDREGHLIGQLGGFYELLDFSLE